MKFSDYVIHCLDTWGIGNDDIRIRVGIEEEFGELSGKVKRFYRGDYENNKDKFFEDITGELGDCLYYVSMAIEKFETAKDFLITDFNVSSFEDKPNDYLYGCWKMLIANKIKYTVNNECRYLFAALVRFANQLGLSINDVVNYNIQKLQDRKNRGVIKGTGDNR